MKRKNSRNRRRVQLLAMFLCFLITGAFLIQVSASKISAESDMTQITYKYYTSVYVERGDSLWSIGQKYITKEYSTVDTYINEVKKINKIKGSQIKQGSYIYVPYYSDEQK